MDLNQVNRVVSTLLVEVGFKLLGAIAVWIIGDKLIEFGMKLLKRYFRNHPIDPTLVNYILNITSVTLRIILVVAILGFLGIQTTSFAALLAAAGVAIGAAWGGLLANFAAGAFLIIFRPFKVGDKITTAGVNGTVREIGLFTSTIDTSDNVRTIVGNNKIFSDNIQNFSANAYRRVDLVAQIHHSVNHVEAANLLKAKIAQIPNVLAQPAPDVEILQFNPSGLLLAVRPYCHNDNYWRVYFQTNKVIRETFTEAGYPIPEESVNLVTHKASEVIKNGVTSRV